MKKKSRSSIKELQRELRRQRGKYVAKRAKKKPISPETKRKIRDLRLRITLRKSRAKFVKREKLAIRRRRAFDVRFGVTVKEIRKGIAERAQGYKLGWINEEGKLVLRSKYVRLPFLNGRECKFLRAVVEHREEYKLWVQQKRIAKWKVYHGIAINAGDQAQLKDLEDRLSMFALECTGEGMYVTDGGDFSTWYH